MGMRKRENPEVHGSRSCIHSEKAIQLQPESACTGKALLMDIETVFYHGSTVRGGTTPCAQQSGYAEGR